MADEQRMTEEMGMFYYDVIRVTRHLFATLHGLEFVRDEQQQLYRPLTPETLSAGMRVPLKPSYLDCQPHVGEHHPLEDLERNGAVEQFAYRAWIVEVYSRWEHRFRPQFKAAVGPTGIPPEINVMNDLRHIRNNLIHAQGQATKEHCGKCEVLRWFELGEQMIFGTRHVLDFAHQIGCMGVFAIATASGYRVSHWTNIGIPDQMRTRHPDPTIVSLRTEPVPHEETGELWAAVSVVYDNGLRLQSARPTGWQRSEQAFGELRKLLSQMHVDANGDVIGPEPWLCMSGRESYLAAIDEIEGKPRDDERPMGFPKQGFYGPWIKFA